MSDLYNYGDDTFGDGSGIGSFGLMHSFQYYHPLISAWSKKELEWIILRDISTPGSYSLDQACVNNDMIMISTGYPSGEYLLIENTQSCVVDTSMSQGDWQFSY